MRNAPSRSRSITRSAQHPPTTRSSASRFATLKKGTTSESSRQFDATSGSLKQILAPLGWKSTAQPITAVTKSEGDGVYEVDAFVNVEFMATSSQAPNGATTTVTYSITIDSKHDWQITDVGGLQSMSGK